MEGGGGMGGRDRGGGYKYSPKILFLFDLFIFQLEKNRIPVVDT